MFETFVSVVFLYFIVKFIYRMVVAGMDLEQRRVQLKTQRQANKHMRDQQKRMMAMQQQAIQMPAAPPSASAAATMQLNSRASEFVKDAKAKQD